MVEFVMDVEEAFCVRIPDEDAEWVLTPRELIDYIHRRLRPGEPGRCLTQRAFYAVRAAIAEESGHTWTAIRPTTRLKDVLARAGVDEVWAAVGARFGEDTWKRLWRRGWFRRGLTVPPTVGDAARTVATRAPLSVKRAGDGWGWHEVAGVVLRLLDHHFAIRNCSLDDSFVKDLGLG